MLATIARLLFGHTLVATLATRWFSISFVIVGSWPIRTVTTIVPRIVAPFSLSVSVSHITPPCYSRGIDYITIPTTNVNTLLSNRGWWSRIGVCFGQLAIALRSVLGILVYHWRLLSQAFHSYYGGKKCS